MSAFGVFLGGLCLLSVAVGAGGCGTPGQDLDVRVAPAPAVAEDAQIGAEVEVGKLDGHQKRIPATVVGFPFYDPEKKRVRS